MLSLINPPASRGAHFETLYEITLASFGVPPHKVPQLLDGIVPLVPGS